MSRFTVLIVIIASSMLSAQAYVPPLQSQLYAKPNTNGPKELNMKGEGTARKLASSLIIGTFLSVNTMCMNPAFASTSFGTNTITYGNNFEPSSSICVSETITTMDFSLPSSYDKISDATASATAELTVETNVLTNTSRKKASTSASSKTKESSSSSIFSFGGDGNLSSEEKAKIAAELRAEREILAAERAAEKAALAAEKAAERELIASQKLAEREALAQQKAAENEAKLALQAEKRAAANAARALAEEKREAKASTERLRGAEFVDFSLPSYEDSSISDGKRDSVFAL